MKKCATWIGGKNHQGLAVYKLLLYQMTMKVKAKRLKFRNVKNLKLKLLKQQVITLSAMVMEI